MESGGCQKREGCWNPAEKRVAGSKESQCSQSNGEGSGAADGDGSCQSSFPGSFSSSCCNVRRTCTSRWSSSNWNDTQSRDSSTWCGSQQSYRWRWQKKKVSCSSLLPLYGGSNLHPRWTDLTALHAFATADCRIQRPQDAWANSSHMPWKSSWIT